MKINRPSKSKTLLICLAFSGALVLGQAEKAHAFVDPITATAAAYVIAYATVVVVAGTYVAAKATVCTPVAAVKAGDHAAGFGGAYKDCWDWSPFSKQPASAESGAAEKSARTTESISAVGSWPGE